MNKPKLLLLLLLSYLAVFGTGCGRAVNRSAERRVRDALPRLIGEAKSYKVSINNDPFKTISGALSNVAIDGDDVLLSNGFLLDHLHLDLKGVSVDTRKGVVKSIRETRFEATVGKANLDEFLAGTQVPEETLRNTRVTLDQGFVTITGIRELIEFRVPLLNQNPVKVTVPFTLTGVLRVAGARRVAFDPKHLTVVGLPLAGKPLAFLTDRFERAVDLNALPFPVTLSDVQIRPNGMILSGVADVSGLLKQ